MNKYEPTVQEYSEHYLDMPHVEVVEYGGDDVVVPQDLMRSLKGYVGSPLVKLPTGHYWLRGEWGVPAETIATPRSDDTDGEVLLAKVATAKNLLHQGVVRTPR